MMTKFAPSILAFLFLFQTSLFAHYEKHLNIPYVKDGGERQQLDLFTPKKADAPTPVIVVIHGGGWGAGSKDGVEGWAHEYGRHGYAVAGINYRLKPEFPMPAQIVDCKSAIRWLRAHAKEYNLDPERIAVRGHSAGGHLCELLGTTGETKEFDQGEHLDQSSAVQAVCSCAGICDFETWARDKTGTEHSYKGLFGGTLEEKRDFIKKMGPVNHVSVKSAPMQLIHAVDDELVPYSQSEEMHEALKKTGVESQLIRLESGDGGHGSKSFGSPETKKAVKEFFDKHLKGIETPKSSNVVPETKIAQQKKYIERSIPKFLISPPSPNWDGSALRSMADHPEQWEECRKHVGAILYADHVLHRQFKDDDKGLTELLGKFGKMNLPFQLEVGAVKPWGETGAIAFEKQYRQWERFLKCGMKIDGLAMDEPLNCCVDHLKKDMEYAATETADFIALVHKNYPDWHVGDIEGFPALTVDQVIQWLDLLQAKLKARGERGLDFFRLDVDWMHFVHNTGRGSWADVRRIEHICRQRKIPFSLVYWAADYPSMLRRNMADDKTWYVGTMQMGYDYVAVGGKPDQFVVQSWVEGPPTILPESNPFSFIRSALDIADRIMNRPPEPPPMPKK